VAKAAQEPSHDEQSPTFVPDVCHALRATFARLRKDASERGKDDVGSLLLDSVQCLQILRVLLTPPSIRQVHASRPSVFDTAAQRGVHNDRCSSHGAFGVATWNISGGQSSAQAPSTWTAVDQNASVIKEINRWTADILALQECESGEPYEGLIPQYKFLGAAEAHRGCVQLYVRIQEGLHAEGIRDESFAVHPVVQATLKLDTVVGEVQRHWRVLAIQLPHGPDKLARRKILDVFVPSADLDDGVLLLGDFNAVDAEVRSFCVSKALTHVAYSGPTWGA